MESTCGIILWHPLVARRASASVTASWCSVWANAVSVMEAEAVGIGLAYKTAQDTKRARLICTNSRTPSSVLAAAFDSSELRSSKNLN